MLDGGVLVPVVPQATMAMLMAEMARTDRIEFFIRALTLGGAWDRPRSCASSAKKP